MPQFSSRSTSDRSGGARPIQRDLMRLSEAAAQVSRSPRTLRRWIDKALLPGFKLSGQLMIRPADLKALIERSRASVDV